MQPTGPLLNGYPTRTTTTTTARVHFAHRSRRLTIRTVSQTTKAASATTKARMRIVIPGFYQLTPIPTSRVKTGVACRIWHYLLARFLEIVGQTGYDSGQAGTVSFLIATECPVMTTQVTKTLPSAKLTLKDKLSRLTFSDACKLLGAEGRKLIPKNANTWEFVVDEHVFLGDDLFRLTFPGEYDDGQPIIVTITLMAEAKHGLHWNCTKCDTACAHAGAAFSLILEQKMALGLAAPPKPRIPVESLDEQTLLDTAMADRRERARTEKMKVVSSDPSKPWTDYTVTNPVSGKSYRVALRGTEPGVSYCSCPDFRTNTLGTCKHVMRVLFKVKRNFTPQQLKKPYRRERLALHLRYDGDVSLRLAVPDKLVENVARIIKPLQDKPIEDLHDLMQRLGKLQKLGVDVGVYPDAEEFIQQRLSQARMRERTAEIRRDPANHPLRTNLVKIALLPYQLDGIAFVAGAGRAVLADEMGLGKTIQGVGTAEFLAREAEIKKVLVVCPASLKSQWRAEIHRFCDRTLQLVGGSSADRIAQYDNNCFFTVCNYEQVLRDILAIEPVKWDLIILDEGQRIKNWAAKTSNVIKSLKSKFALVLTGTPLENRLDDLYSIVQFVDGWRLGPGFRFFNKHRVVDEKGKVLGYKNLGELREALKPILLRRTRDSVKLDLPPRTVDIVRIPPTEEQMVIHRTQMQIVASIIAKKFINEMDLLRLQQALLMCRMTADSTYLCNKQKPGYSTKLEHLDELFERIFEEPERKVVLFSEWTTMLDLIEKLLVKQKLGYTRLDGSVPQKQREELVHRFKTDPECKLFLTTNAGSTGLNLQVANTVINVDLPWNPAVLEQRIARAHRMGQTQPVQVYVLVTEETIEENLLATLAAKKDLALAALDVESEVDAVDMASGMDELKSRLEVLLGAKPEAAVDQTVLQAAVAPGVGEPSPEHRQRVAAAGGELLGAAFKFLGELVAQQAPAAPPSEMLVANLRQGLGACVEDDPLGKPRLTITLPDRTALDNLAQTLAQLLAVGGSPAAQQ
jgi:superfamily II DNA or RNA helicase